MDNSRQLRIALVCPYDWCVDGGVRTHIRELAHHFRTWGHEVTIFAPASKPKSVAGQCVPIGRPMRMPARGSVARILFTWQNRQVRNALNEGQFDVVHMHEPLMPLLPYYFLRNARSVTVGTFHAGREGGNRIYSYTRHLTRRWFRQLDGKIAVSKAAVSLASRYFPGYYNVIPNGIDYEHWAQPHEPFPEFMDGKINILFVGRPEKRKGLKYLLRAYKQMREHRTDIRLIVIMGTGNYRRFERLMDGYDDVVFRSNVPYETLPRYHYSSHIVCCPNTGGESQGYVLTEALAAGRAVVASDIEGFSWVVEHGASGDLVPPGDPGALARALEALADAPERRAELGKLGRERAKRFSSDLIAREVLSYYYRLLDEYRQVEEARPSPPKKAAG